MQSRLVCLLPARNAAHDLPGFFASVAAFCDTVIALDDGSTDDTRERLAAEPAVQTLLTNPSRPDYRGWDDADNRNRLLEAAAAFEPEWIISLDADERIDAGDAAALVAFLATDALPGCAYGFHHVPMRGDGEHYLPRFQWVHRLFSYAPGQRFPDERLHFTPVPTSIPPERWLRTTLRIQHLGGMTPDRRLVRYAKYLEADPHRTYQSDYAHIIDDPVAAELRRWEPRPAGLPVLLPPASADDDAPPTETQDEGEPVISAIVISRDDEATIARSVGSVVGQVCEEPFEVIVVVSGTDRTAEIVRDRFPTARLVVLDRPALPGDARNAGLRLARGTYVTFPGSHIELPPGSLVARIAAHRRGYALVTGVTRNGNETRAGWASYFLDHHNNLPGHGAGEVVGPPAYCSYARGSLLDVGGFPEGVRTAEDTAAIRALIRKGYVAYRDPAVEMVHHSPCSTRRKLVRHHFGRGRGWGRLLLDDHRLTGGLLERRFVRTRLVGDLPRRLHRIRENVGLADDAVLEPYLAARRLVAVGAVSAWLGTWWEILAPASGKLEILVGRPIRTVALVVEGPELELWALRLDLVGGLVQAIALPAELAVADPDGPPMRLDSAIRAALDREAASRAERIRRLCSTVAQIEIEDYVAGTRGALGRLLGSLPGGGADVINETVPGNGSRVAWLGPWLAAVSPDGRGVRTSLGRREVQAVGRLMRRAHATVTVSVAPATVATLIVLPAPLTDESQLADFRDPGTCEPDEEPTGPPAWRAWLP